MLHKRYTSTHTYNCTIYIYICVYAIYIYIYNITWCFGAYPPKLESTWSLWPQNSYTYIYIHIMFSYVFWVPRLRGNEWEWNQTCSLLLHAWFVCWRMLENFQATAHSSPKMNPFPNPSQQLRDFLTSHMIGLRKNLQETIVFTSFYNETWGVHGNVLLNQSNDLILSISGRIRPSNPPISSAPAFSPCPLCAVWLFRAETCIKSKMPAACPCHWPGNWSGHASSQEWLAASPTFISIMYWSCMCVYSCSPALPSNPAIGTSSTSPVGRSCWHCPGESHWTPWPGKIPPFWEQMLMRKSGYCNPLVVWHT